MSTPSTGRTLIAAPRLIAAWALVGYAGLYLAFAFLNWVLPDGGTFSSRSAGAGFTALVELALPLAAALLATGAGLVSPVPQAKLITTVALVEYAVMLLLGALTFLIGLAALDSDTANEFFDSLGYVMLGLGRLGLAALAGLVVYQAWVRLGGYVPVTITRVPPPAPPSS
jgi:hypothetical protein